MTPAEHYAEAERCLAAVDDPEARSIRPAAGWVALAQVHATLATPETT